MTTCIKAITVLAINFVLLSSIVCAQDTIIPKDTIFTVVEQTPMFIGGDNALNEYLYKNIVIPETEKEITGAIFVSFVVSSDGSIRNVKLLRGIKESPGLTKEVLRVISEMPKWKPGRQSGEKVNVQYQIPVRFPLKK